MSLPNYLVVVCKNATGAAQQSDVLVRVSTIPLWLGDQSPLRVERFLRIKANEKQEHDISGQSEDSTSIIPSLATASQHPPFCSCLKIFATCLFLVQFQTP